MQKKFLTLCIDLEEFSLPQEFGTVISAEDQFKISFNGAQRLNNLLKEINIKATFFTTESMARHFPGLLRSLMENGHEVGLHYILDKKDSATNDGLKRQKSVIESIIGSKIYGCRSHKFVCLPPEAMSAAGFIYDNSLHPTYVPGRYCNILKSRKICTERGLTKVPISVTPLLRLPFSWFWFRILGLSYAKFCSRMAYLNQEYINIYFHSWDFAEVGNLDLSFRCKLLLRNCGIKALSELGDYLKWCLQKNIKIMPMREYINGRCARQC